MNFFKNSSFHDTIAAIATPPGEGALAIIRISGKEAFAIANKIFSKPLFSFASHTAHFGKILDERGKVIDSVLLLVLHGPRSYTGEDTVEIFCHGGRLVPKLILERALQAGARAAEPGEFSLKAFLNHKIDLSQAEAVQSLIGAQNHRALAFAEQQLEGKLSQKITCFQKNLIDHVATLEALLDFPEEELESTSKEEILFFLKNLIKEMEALSSTFYEGKKLSEGASLCIVGTPNVGKSSLMNALLGKERAIVTHIPGTTRDLLEEKLLFGSLHLRLIDSAGIRKTEEAIEKEGIDRAEKARKESDYLFLVLDASLPLSQEDQALLELCPSEKTIVIWNKIDLAPPSQTLSHEYVVSLSAKERIGFDRLKETLERLIWKKGLPSEEELLITQLRHKQALDQALLFCKEAISGFEKSLSLEFIVLDLRSALHELGKILGSDITEEVLSAIFSKFCVGK